MKVTWRVASLALLLFLVVAPAFRSPEKTNASPSTGDNNFYVGVTYGGDSVSEAKSLIDNVSSYTNLLVVDSATISGASNSTALDEICEYAVKANMSVIVYFYMIYYNVTTNITSVYNSSSWDAYGLAPWHVSWLNSTEDRFGDKFLGVYLFDEPGGKQIDTGYWGGTNTTFSGSRVRTFDNVTSYDDAANRYVSSIWSNRGMQILSNTSYPNGLNFTIPAFTSDYALYWFDYKAGYSAIFAELGGNRGVENITQQIALCRGAAQEHQKDWGAIITWATDNPPTPETGTVMLQDMTLAYDAGAKYVIAFNYAVNGTGGLTDEQFGAIKQFWTNIHTSPRNGSGQVADRVAFVLPTNYGWGMRTPDDKIWGLWPADNQSLQIWQNMNTLLGYYGPRLDIVYDDPQFNITGTYIQTYLWNSTIIAVVATPVPTTAPTTNVNSPPTPAPTPTPTTSATPTPSPKTSSAPRNNLPLIALVIVPICVIAFIGFYLRKQSKKLIKPTFPAVPINAKLKGFGEGTLQLSGATLTFTPKQSRFRNNTESATQIELAHVETLTTKGNQISLQHDGKTYAFSINKKLAPQIYSSIKPVWNEQKKTIEEAAAMPEQKQLKRTFMAVAQYVDSLFDIFSHLHGEIDWKSIEDCLRRCEEYSANASGAGPTETNADLASLSTAIKQRTPDLVAKETRLVLQSTYEQVLSLHSENQSFEEFRPNYGDLKTAVTAHYALNDILLGEAVGDADLANERAKLAAMLNHLPNRRNSTENQKTYAQGENNAVFSENRSLFATHVAEALNPDSPKLSSVASHF